MSNRPLDAVTSPKVRTALFYLTAFTIPGACAAYLGIWLTDQGLSSGEVGWISSVPIFLLLFFNIHVGRLADRAGDWRNVIIAGAALSGLLTAGMFFVNGFWGILIMWTVAGLPAGLVTPVIDAAVLRMTRRTGGNFAALRAFGTVGYMLALSGVAWAADTFGGGAFLPVILGLALTRAALSFLLPRLRAPAATPPPTPAPGRKMRLAELLKPWFLAPIVAFALVQSLHYVIGTFAGIVWRDNGIPELYVGPLLALGAASEVTAMFLFKRIAGQFGARHLMAFAMLVSAGRWAVMALNPPLWLLALLQLTHGITFGICYLGLMNFIANWTPEDVAAEAQSFATVVQLSFVVVTISAFGYLIDGFGIQSFSTGLVFSLVALVLVLWSLRAMPTSETSPAASSVIR